MGLLSSLLVIHAVGRGVRIRAAAFIKTVQVLLHTALLGELEGGVRVKGDVVQNAYHRHRCFLTKWKSDPKTSFHSNITSMKKCNTPSPP